MSKKNINPALFERGEPHWGHGRGEDVGVLKDLILEADGRGARVLPQEAHEIHGAQPVVPSKQPEGINPGLRDHTFEVNQSFEFFNF